MRSLPRVLGACVLAVTMTATGLAFGGDTSTAEHLFRQGLESMKHSQFKEACDAFAGSNEADPSPGTEINLALCNEKQGKLATAWGWYRTAAGLADQRGQKERADLARAEAVKLEPKLHKLIVTVKFPAEGLVVTRNGQPVPNATLGTDVPIDPGDYAIEVSAKGKLPWRQTIKITAGPGADRIDVPALADAPVEVKPVVGAGGPTGGPDYVPPAPTRDGSTQRIVGLGLGGAGVVAGIVAIVYEVVALSEDKKRKGYEADVAADRAKPPAQQLSITDRSNLEQAVESRRDAAKTNETTAIVAGIGGGVLLGVGITLLLTAPSSKSTGSITRPLVVPLLGRDNGGLGLVGTF